MRVEDNPSASRYELFVDGQVAGYAEYELRDDRIELVHTEVEAGHEGAGLGSKLARAVLDDARTRGLPVEPTCEFMAGYIARHKDEYLELVVPELRDQVSG
jgi:predicted GNAT family acetyltransferase